MAYFIIPAQCSLSVSSIDVLMGYFSDEYDVNFGVTAPSLAEAKSLLHPYLINLTETFDESAFALDIDYAKLSLSDAVKKIVLSDGVDGKDFGYIQYKDSGDVILTLFSEDDHGIEKTFTITSDIEEISAETWETLKKYSAVRDVTELALKGKELSQEISLA